MCGTIRMGGRGDWRRMGIKLKMGIQVVMTDL